MRSVNRPVTAPGLWLNEVSSVLKRSVPGPAASANRRMTGSRSSWAQRQFLTGVTAMFFGVARPGTRRSISLPEDFHRPGIDPARLRRERRARVTFDEQRAHAVPGEE